jgi:hypothetical protein
MASHLTLEEAAEQLGISTEDFKRRLKTESAFKALVPIRDGNSLRFKSAAIEELARELGAASNPELPLAGLKGDPLPPDSDDFKISSDGIKKEAKPAAVDSHDSLNLSSSDDDMFSLAPEESKSEKKVSKPGSDSDVRLEGGKSKKGKAAKDDDESVVPTEELSIDFNGPGSAVIKGGSSAKLSAPKSSGKIPKPDSGKNLAKSGASDSSEFELSLDADSDDFELKLNSDASDEVDLGELPKDTSSGRRTGGSGINLRDPKDSGISLEKGKGKESADKAKPPVVEDGSSEEVDFELTLDSSAGASSLKLGGVKPTKAKDEDSDSEFELTLDDSSDSGLEASDSGDAEKRDIFETDFEIPPMDESGSEAIAVDPDTDLERSDSDVEESSDIVVDESGSEVVLIDEEEAEASPKARSKRKAVSKRADDDSDVDLADVDLADDEDASASKALKGAKRRSDEDEDEEEEELAAAGAGAYRPIPWGPLPAIFLFPALAISVIGALVGFELLQTMVGYQQPRKPAAPLVRALASNFDMELKDQ